MKTLTNSELAKALNINAGDTKILFFENKIFYTGKYNSGYNFKGVKITERENNKTSVAFIYDFEISTGKIEDRFIEWNQVPAEIKKQTQKKLGL